MPSPHPLSRRERGYLPFSLREKGGDEGTEVRQFNYFALLLYEFLCAFVTCRDALMPR
jgi:hypothetical protein